MFKSKVAHMYLLLSNVCFSNIAKKELFITMFGSHCHMLRLSSKSGFEQDLVDIVCLHNINITTWG